LIASAVCQWNEERERLNEMVSNLHSYQENCEQWQLSIDQIKDERDKVTDSCVCCFAVIIC